MYTLFHSETTVYDANLEIIIVPGTVIKSNNWLGKANYLGDTHEEYTNIMLRHDVLEILMHTKYAESCSENFLTVVLSMDHWLDISWAIRSAVDFGLVAVVMIYMGL